MSHGADPKLLEALNYASSLQLFDRRGMLAGAALQPPSSLRAKDRRARSMLLLPASFCRPAFARPRD